LVWTLLYRDGIHFTVRSGHPCFRRVRSYTKCRKLSRACGAASSWPTAIGRKDITCAAQVRNGMLGTGALVPVKGCRLKPRAHTNGMGSIGSNNAHNGSQIIKTIVARVTIYRRRQKGEGEMKRMLLSAAILMASNASMAAVIGPCHSQSICVENELQPGDAAQFAAIQANTASAHANTPAQLAQANTSHASEGHPAPSLSMVDEARADESKVVNRKIYNDRSTGNVPSKFQYFKPFSKEWNQRREEEARRLKAATTICRC
jgi:hypothetical protein